MTTRQFFSLLVFIGCLNYGDAQIDYKGFPQWKWHQEDSTEYYLYTPEGMEAGKKYPIALFMHGCCGENYHATLRNAVDPPVRMWHNFGANTQAVPTYIIAPATSQGWSQHFNNLKKVIDDLITNHNGDAQRIYVCGFSMGGEGTFKIIQEYPGYFAAAMPMGMSFRGDSTKIKDIPVWTSQGETDWYARYLRKQVAAIRHLNGYAEDTGSTWITGVNPRYSNFKGVGHGVQWEAVSTQDLTGWAYSKINDGNKYPVIYFNNAKYKELGNAGKKANVEITATDPDGTITKVEVHIRGKLAAILDHAPYHMTFTLQNGDNVIDAVAYDNKGKTSIATTIVKVNVPPKLVTTSLPASAQGVYYSHRLKAEGNGELIFSLKGANRLPQGLWLYPDGTIKGLPLEQGTFRTTITLADEDNEATDRSFTIVVKQSNRDVLLIKDAKTADGYPYRVSKMMNGETPNFSRKDSILSAGLEEINFSDIGRYAGLTYIKTAVDDTARTDPAFLSFVMDRPAMVYIAYEKLDNLLRSTIPGWLQGFTKEEGEIVAQYRYFNVYSKRFPAGRVVLPGADAIRNGVSSNYFVMVKAL